MVIDRFLQVVGSEEFLSMFISPPLRLTAINCGYGMLDMYFDRNGKLILFACPPIRTATEVL